MDFDVFDTLSDSDLSPFLRMTARLATRLTSRSVCRSAKASSSNLRAFSTSRPTLEGEEKKESKKEKAKEQPNDTTVAGRSPFQAFVDVMKDEIRKNREFQDSVKQLGGEVTKVQDSAAMKAAKDAYERARVSGRLL